MIWPQLQITAQLATGRLLNSLPEGLLIALFAGVMLRLLPRQNSGTRFAVWFVALLAVAGLPFIGGVSGGHILLAAHGMRPVITLPGGLGLFLFLVWVLAAFVAILRLVIGLCRLRALRRSCVPIDGRELEPSIRNTLEDFSSAKSVSVATSERMSVPAAIGFFKPMVVIPVWALRELAPAELNVILLHEFAHLRRADAWTNLLQKTVRAVFLFHPAVWWIENRLSLEREMACDDQVLAETANPHRYAKCLIALLEKSVARRSLAMAQTAVHRAREASLRLAQILDATRPDTRRVWKPALGVIAIFSVTCFMVAPHVPQFVAFEANRPVVQAAISGSGIPLPTVSKTEFPAAVAVPAALRTSASSLKKMAKPPGTQASRHPHENQPVAPQIVAAGWFEDVMFGEVSEPVIPMPETLLVIRTTERIGPNAWVSRISVWRVTWQSGAPANSDKNIAAREPFAHKT